MKNLIFETVHEWSLPLFFIGVIILLFIGGWNANYYRVDFPDGCLNDDDDNNNETDTETSIPDVLERSEEAQEMVFM